LSIPNGSSGVNGGVGGSGGSIGGSGGGVGGSGGCGVLSPGGGGGVLSPGGGGGGGDGGFPSLGSLSGGGGDEGGEKKKKKKKKRKGKKINGNGDGEQSGASATVEGATEKMAAMEMAALPSPVEGAEPNDPSSATSHCLDHGFDPNASTETEPVAPAAFYFPQDIGGGSAADGFTVAGSSDGYHGPSGAAGSGHTASATLPYMPTTIMDLPDEMLSRIFLAGGVTPARLCCLALTCHRWAAVLRQACMERFNCPPLAFVALSVPAFAAAAVSFQGCETFDADASLMQLALVAISTDGFSPGGSACLHGLATVCGLHKSLSHNSPSRDYSLAYHSNIFVFPLPLKPLALGPFSELPIPVAPHPLPVLSLIACPTYPSSLAPHIPHRLPHISLIACPTYPAVATYCYDHVREIRHHRQLPPRITGAT